MNYPVFKHVFTLNVTFLSRSYKSFLAVLNPCCTIFAKLSNPGIYVILKSRSQLLPGKVAQISGFYCGWKMFWQKFCVVANWSPTVSSQGGVKHNHVLGEDCPQSPFLNFKLFKLKFTNLKYKECSSPLVSF